MEMDVTAKMGSKHPQLPLNIKIREEYTFANYVPDNNSAVVDSLKNQLSNKDGSYIYLWGKAGVGLSHLLQAACQEATEKGGSAIYLPMQELINLDPNILKGMDELDLVCIDDIELIGNNKPWQEAMFFLFNRLQQNNGALLVAANAIPQQVGIKLQDLVSRLASGVIYQVQALSEEGKRVLLQRRAKDSGLELADEATQYILNRAERGVPRLLEILAVLDEVSLASHRKLTIPFIKETMDW